MSEDSKLYGEFLQEQRTQKGIERDALSEGIFIQNMLGKIERGERYPDKMTRDRLLARLGESGYDYECFLQADEYEDWEERRDILDSLDNLELEKAEQLLEQYEKKHDREGKVSRQFLLTMRVQLMKLKGVPKAEWGRILEETVKLTIPAVDKKTLHQLVVSLQELNLILEYQAYKYPEILQEHCMQLMEYLQKGAFDLESKAMLGAKIALYYCSRDGWKEEKTGIMEQVAKVQRALDICTGGIEALRDKQKIYFAWELLQKKEQYLLWLLEHKTLFVEKQIEQYEAELTQTKEFYKVIDDLYERFRVPKKTNGFTCFYREHEIYCINDVIRARRRMLGITAEELEGQLLCGKRTLIRLEAKETKVQRAVAQNLFSYLKLSPEMHRAQIITDNQEALRLEEKFRWAYDQRDYESSELLLQQLKTMLLLTELINWQYISYGEKKLAYDKGELSKEDFIQYAKETLELTVPIEISMTEIKDRKLPNGRFWAGEKYLTNTEVTILHNIARVYGSDIENEYWEVLKEYFEWLENKCTLPPILGMYGFVMTSVASWMGNLHRFDEANAINKKIMRELLRARSFSYAHRNMYCLLWNDRKQKGLPMEKEDPEWQQGLMECLTVDTFCKDEWRAANMRYRLGLK